MSEYDDGWVPGFPKDGPEFAGWVDKGTPPPHHLKWDEALQQMVERETTGWEPGRKEERDIVFRIRATRYNPGWVDGYRAEPGG